ncbi:PDC sensor domain-containing protein [Vibrio quintilis]|uniref:Methyl-accepting chemotaxis protein PctA n=1 Tax=Vibrio quintilis TaxID=1117707 RepID=A0A1M7YVQ1_9VIBR|nr:cache domain-containing protein [Vibrio quintilis]SHO56760.1 Methyl-accepting chemotaxis protein PctA [Vibrio quintilis]
MTNRILTSQHLRRTCLVFAFIAAGLLLLKFQWQTQIDTKIRHDLVYQSIQAGTQINQRLETLTSLARMLRLQIIRENLSDQQIRQKIRDAVKNTEGVFRGGIAFKRNRWSGKTALYSPYYQKNYHNSASQQITDSYNYTKPDSAEGERTVWFNQPLELGNMWTEPYFDKQAGTWLITYSMPFRSGYDGQRNNGNDGVVFLSLSLDELTNKMFQLHLGNQGFGVLISGTGKLITSPDQSIIGHSIFQLSPKGYPLLNAISPLLQRGELSTFIHPLTGHEQWMVLRRVDALNAWLALIIDANELRLNRSVSKWYWDMVPFFSIAALVTLLASYHFPTQSHQATNRVYTALSVCLFSCLLLLWYQALTPKALAQGQILLVDKQSARMALKKISAVSAQKITMQHVQPIRIEIQSIDLLKADQISLIGEVISWSGESKYPPLQIDYVESINWSLKRSYPKTQVWEFVATIKQPFDYGSFPLDNEIIRLTLLPPPYDKETILIPQFSSYNSMRPESRPGVAIQKDEFSGWKLLRTFFNYQRAAFTGYGEQAHLLDNLPAINLDLNIVIQRNITGPIISHIMPLLVVSFLTYCMLRLWTKDEKKQALWGFSTATVLQYCASLFFILIIAHVALRDALNAHGIIFIEYFYFLAYLQIMFTAIGALVYTSGIHVRVFEYEQGARIKQWYWPFILMLSLLITTIFIEK